MPKITNSNGDLNKAFFGTAEVEKIFLGSTELYSKAPAGYTVTIDANNFVAGIPEIRAEYSLNNGVNWIDIPRAQTISLTNVTTIKFRVWANSSIVAPELDCSALGLSLHPFDSDIYMQYMTSSNYTLTENITVVVDIYYD